MYTSCGWFFDDVGGIEARQVIQYAGRVLQLSGELFGSGLEERFLGLLEKAKSNDPEARDGRKIYEESVRPAMVSLEKVGAHYGVSSLFFDYGDTARVYCYDIAREDYRLDASGRARLALGRARVRSEITGEAEDVAFGVLHLGDHNLSGGAIPFPGESEYEKLAAEIAEPFRKADLTETLRTVDRHFGSGVYTLRLLFRDEQQQVLGRILRSVLGAADTVYRELYEEHAPIMRFLSSHGIAQPRGFRMAAELALNMSLRQELEAEAPDPARLAAVLEEARNVGVTLHEDGLGLAVEHTLERLAEGLRGNASDVDAARGARGRRGPGPPAAVRSGFLEGPERVLRAAAHPAARTPARGGCGIRGCAPVGRTVPRPRREALGQGGRGASGRGVPRSLRPQGLVGRVGLLHFISS